MPTKFRQSIGGLAHGLVYMAMVMPSVAEPLDAVRVLELGELERWHAVGTMSSSVTGANIVILEEEASGQSKIAHAGSMPMKGVKILSVSPGDVLLEVHGRPLRLAVTRGAEPVPQSFSEPAETNTPPDTAAPPGITGSRHVRLTLDEFHETASLLRRAFLAGDLGLGKSEHGVYGILIGNLPPDGITERLGLQKGDVVVAIDGVPTANEGAALDLLDAAAPGQILPFAFRRGRQVGQGIVEIESE